MNAARGCAGSATVPLGYVLMVPYHGLCALQMAGTCPQSFSLPESPYLCCPRDSGTAPARSPLPQWMPPAPRDHPAPPSTQMHPNISTPTSSQRDTGASHSPGSRGSRCQPRGCGDTGHWAVPSMPVLSLLALCTLVCPRKGLVLLHPQPPPLAGPGAARLLACPSSKALAGRAGVSRRSMCPSIPHSSAGCSPTALLINCPLLLLLLWECWARGC